MKSDETNKDKIFTITYGSTHHNKKHDVEDDYVVKTMGAFGLWQALVCVAAGSTRVIAMWNMISIVLLTPPTEFKCIKFKDDARLVVNNSTCYKNCLEYEYYSIVFDKTLISEFNLICENAWLASFTQTILMFGLLLGVGIFGWLSDRYGRRLALLLATFMDVVFMIAVSFSTTYWIFTSLRFFIGMATGGNLIISVVYVLEVIGINHRELAGCLVMLPDGIAQASLSLFGYLSPTWNIYLLEYGILSILFLTFILFLPETPRWLMSNGKFDKAAELMTRAAKCNKLSIVGIKDTITKSAASIKSNRREVTKLTYIDLFRSRNMCTKTVSSFVIWTVNGICYFGINQYVTFLGSNVFIVVVVLGLFQIPTSGLAMVLSKKLGRKLSTMATLIAIGISMIALIFIPEGHIAGTVIGIIGLSASATTFAVIYVYASELFPTSLRNMGYGLSSAGAKVGAMVAPFIANISPQWIPSLIFAVLPFVAVAFCILLPETRGQKLQDTIE